MNQCFQHELCCFVWSCTPSLWAVKCGLQGSRFVLDKPAVCCTVHSESYRLDKSVNFFCPPKSTYFNKLYIVSSVSRPWLFLTRLHRLWRPFLRWDRGHRNTTVYQLKGADHILWDTITLVSTSPFCFRCQHLQPSTFSLPTAARDNLSNLRLG